MGTHLWKWCYLSRAIDRDGNLVGTVSTPEASTFVVASDQPLGLVHSSFLLASHPAILFLYGSCDGTPRASASNL